MSSRLNQILGRLVPEQRIYIRSNKTTRYLRVTPFTQIAFAFVIAVGATWTLISSAILIEKQLASKSAAAQTELLQDAYEERIKQLANERDQRASEAETAIERFYVALEQISAQQSQLLELEEQRRELGEGVRIMQRKLQDAVKARDIAEQRAETIIADLETQQLSMTDRLARIEGTEATLGFLTDALQDVSLTRDKLKTQNIAYAEQVAEMKYNAALLQERGNQIFGRLESAVDIALTPLERALDRKGVNTNALVEEVKSGFSGTGGPITPLIMESGSNIQDDMSLRASKLLADLDRVNIMKLAAQRVPLTHPVRGRYRYTSGYGFRRHPVTGATRMHSGIDMAGARNTAIVATGDGVVTFAGTKGGYGRIVEIRHSLGFETRYAHLNTISVKKGQRVTKGEKIGGMGNTGQSTGVHLHYEVRQNGTAINPMIYLKAANDVF